MSLLFGALFLALAAGLLTGAYWQLIFAGGQPRLATFVGLPLVSLSIVLLLSGSTLPLRVDLGFTAHHSDVLLPLNVATYCNHLQVKRKLRAGPAPTMGGWGGRVLLQGQRSPSPSAGAGKPLFSVALLQPPGKLAADLGDVELALSNVAGFLSAMGLSAERFAMDGGEEEAGARSSATIFVFVLPTVEAAEAWRDRWSASLSTSRTVLVVTDAVMRSCAFVRDLMLVIVGAQNGLFETSPYATEGFAVALIDALGAKVGPAFLERERETRKLGLAERAVMSARSSPASPISTAAAAVVVV